MSDWGLENKIDDTVVKAAKTVALFILRMTMAQESGFEGSVRRPKKLPVVFWKNKGRSSISEKFRNFFSEPGKIPGHS